jgi:catechol 2,3-dioxygenase-like lactoylglutathione lyase family enzyme
MIKARRIGHATFDTTDLDRLAEHYVNVTGLIVAAREKDKVFLASKLGHLAVELRLKSSTPFCRKLSFEVSNDTSIGDVEKELTRHGIKSERSNDVAPGIANTLTFTDPKGTQVELFTAWNSLGDVKQAKGANVLKLGHVAYFTPDVKKTMDFYQNVLGFKVSDWIGDFFVFMRCNPDHHTVNFMHGEEARLHHMAFQLDGWEQMKVACDVLGRNNIEIAWGPVRHGPGHNIATYYRNPDDHIIELFCDLDIMIDEELGYFEPKPWHRDNPQRPKVWQPGPSANIWGPPPSEEFRRK